MTRFLILAALAASVGCTGIQSTGPLSKYIGPGSGPADAKAEPEPDPDSKATAVGPTTPAGRPVPPAILITPGEVAVDNPTAAATKLGNEIEYDLKNTPPAPKTPIISRYKNGEKVE
jgi:hypothetical protein